VVLFSVCRTCVSISPFSRRFLHFGLVQNFVPYGSVEGPQAMLKSAILYGGFVYLLSGGSGRGRLEYINDSEVGF
jgi:hypothetical protein